MVVVVAVVVAVFVVAVVVVGTIVVGTVVVGCIASNILVIPFHTKSVIVDFAGMVFGDSVKYPSTCYQENHCRY